MTADFSIYNGTFHGYTNPGYTISPYQERTCTWTLYSNGQTAYITGLSLASAAFEDGSAWNGPVWFS